MAVVFEDLWKDVTRKGSENLYYQIFDRWPEKELGWAVKEALLSIVADACIDEHGGQFWLGASLGVLWRWWGRCSAALLLEPIDAGRNSTYY